MTTRDMTTTPRVLLDGLAYVESPRWHEGRLWFAHWGAGEVVAVGLDGRSEVVAHADLGAVADFRWNEIVVDGRGNIYVNGFGFDVLGGEPPEPGVIALVTVDGRVRCVATEIDFPNGMVVTPDNSTLIISESFAGRLTAFDIDADGAVWTQAADTRTHTGRPESAEGACIRVEEGGRVLQRIEHDRAIFAAMLGGPDRRSLFMAAAEWQGTDGVQSALAARTGQVLVVDAPAPGVGWPGPPQP
jgi:sugar lactone lactonase YvrE